MTLGTLKQMVKILNEVVINYQDLIEKKEVIGTRTGLKKLKEDLQYFKNYITVLTASIQKLIQEEKDGL